VTTHEDLLLGAYAMAPADPTAEEAFYEGVADLGVGGLEIPLPLPGAPGLEPSWIARNVLPVWDLMVRCIPTVMGRLGADRAYGLASADEAARSRALADVARARELAVRLADEYGRRRIVAIQVHSAPGPEGGSRDAFSRSLAQICAWDLAGAEVLVEHCDASVPGQVAAKGFWSIQDEIAVVRTVGAGAEQLGLSINWGRSAIEGRSVRTAVEHVRAAVEAGLLRAVLFSGATETETAWGPAWSDTHTPPRGDYSALAASSASLLGPEEITATLRAAGDVPCVAVKVSVRPKDADVPTRLAVARVTLAQVALSRARLQVPATGEMFAGTSGAHGTADS